MIKKHLFGIVTFKIDGFDTVRLNEQFYRSCKVISLYTKSDTVWLTTYGIYEKRVRKICEQYHCICEVTEKKGAAYVIRRYIKRFGIVLGATAAAALIFFLSNIVMKIEIEGVSDEDVISEIRSILSDEGLSAGAYIPSLNYLDLSNKLFRTSDNVAWASIGNIGSVVYVNVSEPTKKIETENTHIPCNIVASQDAVIVNAEVLAGQLKVLIGDAVYKGQTLVSGVIEQEDHPTKYLHSTAKIIGRYEQEVVFKQSYIEESTFSGKVSYRRGLKLFEFEIPLPGDVLNGETVYSERTQTTPVKLFGLTLPISVVTHEYTEKYNDIKTYSTAEALSVLYNRLENYEKNFLSDVEVVERNVTEYNADDGVALSVKYTLEGEIGEVSEIYIQ